MAKKIYIDPGHGGRQSGAVNVKRKESDDVLRLSLKVFELLKNQDCEVRMSRTTDKDVDINDRCADANRWGADYFLSIHRNAADKSATGNEIWIYSKATDITKAKAQNILNAVCKVDGLRNRGVHKGAPSYTDFGVNRITKMHSALLELGFISNQSDNRVYDKYIDEYALALAKVLLSLVGSKWKEPFIPGDVDGDGKKTAADARTVLRASARLETLTEEQKKAADVNGDNLITAADAQQILKEAAGLKK